VRLPLSERFLAETRAFELRAGCPSCFHRLADGRCGNGWPLEGQELAPDELAARGDGEAVFCREFELA